MKLNWHKVILPLARPFSISRGTRTEQPSLYVELEHEGVVGLGEVTENSYYGHTFDSITASLQKAGDYLEEYVNSKPTEGWQRMGQIMDGDMFALSALDIAAHDLRGKRMGLPTWQEWGLDWTKVCSSSYTIGIDGIDKMIEKLADQPNWKAYKIKLGTDHDLEIVRGLREHSDAVFRVDANCGWNLEQAIHHSEILADLGVEFIEQPLPVSASSTDKRELYQNSALPIIADEDCQVISDVEQCNGFYHGINVKVSKCGGLTPALQMLHQAKQLGMKTMVGCMIESSIGISGAAQLLPLLDYADLDGAVLLKDEPARGIQIDKGQVAKPDQPGCGAGIDFERLSAFSPV